MIKKVLVANRGDADIPHLPGDEHPDRSDLYACGSRSITCTLCGGSLLHLGR